MFARINLNDYRFAVLVASLFSGFLAFLVLRGVLLSPGVVESIDIQWNNYISMFEKFFHTWNFYTGGSNVIFVSQFPVYGLVLIIRDVAVAQRVVYFLVLSLVSFNMFLVSFFSLKKAGEKHVHSFLGSAVASFFYTINPFVFSEVFHISFLWSYSLFPLVYYFTLQSLDAFSRRRVLVSALLLSVFFAFMTDAWGMTVALLLFLVVAFSSIVLREGKNSLRLPISNFLLTLLIMGLATPLLGAYWLAPYLTQRPSEPVWDPFSVTTLFRNSQYNSLPNVFGLHAWSSQPFFSLSADPMSYVWLAATLVLPIFAVSAILLRRDKTTITLSILLVVSAFLAKGVQPPVGEFYLWLTFFSPKIVPNQSFLLKYPYLFLAVVSLSYSLLASAFVASMFGKSSSKDSLRKRFPAKSRRWAIVFFFSITAVIALAGAPMLSGNLNGALKPVLLPSQYRELNQFLSSQEGTFRVMWLPQTAAFTWSPNPYANKIEYWGSAVPPLMYGWGISASPYAGFLGNMIYESLSKNQTLYVGKLLGLANVRYVVFHNDTADSADYRQMLNSLLSQKDLKLVFSKDNLFAFENMQVSNYFRALKKANIVVGGFDVMRSLSSVDDFYLDESAFLFVERQHMSESDLSDILSSNDLNKTLLFYGSKSFDDFLLDTIDAQSIVVPGERFISTYPISGWSKDTVTSHLWTPITLGEYEGEKYDFSLDKPILHTSLAGSNLNLSVNVDKSEDYDVWIRLLLNPKGGKLSFSISNTGFLTEIDTLSPALEGFKWLHLGKVYLQSGTHEIQIISENGFNAINLVGLPTVTYLEKHRSDLNDLIDRSNATIAYIMDKAFLDSHKTQMDTARVTIYIPLTSSYVINAILSSSPKSGLVNVRVDDQVWNVDVDDSSESPNLFSTVPRNLDQGFHVIELNAHSLAEIESVIAYSTQGNKTRSLRSIFGDGLVPYVVDYKKSGPVSFSVSVNSSKAFILAFKEPYDEFWQSSRSVKKLILDSVVNGFFVDDAFDISESELSNISINYSPEAAFQMGVMLSTASLVFTFVAISVVLLLPKFREKRSIQMMYKGGPALKSLKPMMGGFSLSASDTVLDAGCGYGVRSLEIGEEVGSRVISIDLSQGCLKTLNSQKGGRNINIILADLQNLPLKDSSVDKVVSGDVLEHIPSVCQTLREFNRILREAGMAFLLVPSKISENLYVTINTKYKERKDHLRTFVPEELLGLVRSAGFCVLTSYHAEFFRAIYHLLQVLSKSEFEHQTGRPVAESAGLSTLWRVSRVSYYSWVGDLVEAVGSVIFPNSFVVVAVRTSTAPR